MHLPCSRTDPDGVWIWESADEEWVYGYGLLVAVDCASDLPAGAVVVQRKQHPETATLECFERLVESTDVTVVLGDSAFDTLEFHDRCVDRQILPVCTYNPRNTTDPLDIVFRIEDTVEEHDIHLDRDALSDAFDGDSAVERFFSTFKEDDRKVVRRLCFVSNLYAGDTIEEAARRVGASQSIGSQWLARWNEDGSRGLIPRFGGLPPPKLSHQQSRNLQRLLEEGQPWMTGEITRLIEDEFDVSYHPGHVGRICRTVYGMSYVILRPETPSLAENTEEILAERLGKALGEEDNEEAVDPGETVSGSFDALWPMPTENRHRLWGFGTPRIVKHMPRVKTTTVGFYAINGVSVLRAVESLHKERSWKCSKRSASRIRPVGFYSSWIASPRTFLSYTRTRAEELGITLVFLPVASPHLQPIEPVWNSLKRTISLISTESADDFRALVKETFLTLTQRLSFAADWIDRFLNIYKLR